MEKKGKGNNNNTVFKHVIYPKELSGYVLITLLVSAISSLFLYLGIKAILSEKISTNEVFWIVSAIIIMFLPSTYFVLSLYMLLYKKIYIETTESSLKIKKIFKTQIVNISEIDSVEEKSEYRNTTKIIIKTKSSTHGNDNITIKFPIIWFSSSDLKDLIYYLRNRNKSIYYRTYRVSAYTGKRKPYIKDKLNK